MQTQTLAELRAENAELEGKEPEETPTEGNEPEQLAADDETQEPAEPGEAGQEGGEESTVEPWQLAEGEESGSVPVAKHASVRSKLKGEVAERDREIEQLKAQIQQLQGGMAPGQQPQQGYQPGYQPPPQQRAVPMPRLEDFDHDEARHAAAVEAWQLSQMQRMHQAQQQHFQQQQQVTQRKQVISSEVDNHYNRAQELTVKAGISAEAYRDADLAVRQAIDAVAPGQGDAITDDIIARLGPGSEKVLFHLGRNPSKQAILQQKLRQDPFEAMAYLGRLSGEITAPVKRKSNAPKPASRANSGNTSTDDEGKMKRRYQNAKSAQDRWKISREAKKAGIDSSGW